MNGQARERLSRTMAVDPPSNSSSRPDIAEWQDEPPLNSYSELFGPLKRRRIGDRWAYGLRVREVHRNGAGVMHGGAMTALIDEVIGTVAREAVSRAHVTVHLSATFLKPVLVGEFIEITHEIVKVTGSMTFVEAKLRVADAVVATASLILKATQTGDRGR